jgi:glycosyltransferase involved in cell wall biosynthesis
MNSKKKVAIIYRYIPQYRFAFYNRLKLFLKDKGIDLILIYGQPGKNDQSKKDAIDIPWGKRIRNRIFTIGGKEIYWQPSYKLLKGVDLIIIEHASKLLLNYILLLFKPGRIAFWGHGRNFQEESANKLAEFLKVKMSQYADWWFAYTDISKTIITDQGYPQEKITVVQNSIDLSSLRKTYLGIRKNDVIQKRDEIGIKGSHIGLFIGAMYKEKRIDFLIKACKLIRQRISDFEMVFIGAGNDRHFIETESKTCDWIHLVESKFDSEKVPYFALSNVLLLPGAVGLAVLDSFAMELPIITTKHPSHGPETSYLENGINGIILDENNDVEVYANSIINVLMNPDLLIKLKRGCIDSIDKYSLENMVFQFGNGIIKALA